MKEVFTAMSRYNQKTNEIIFAYFEKMSFEQMISSVKAYYPTIVSNTYHVLSSDIKWLTRLSKFRETAVTKETLDIFSRDEKVHGESFFLKIREYKELRTRIDREIVALVEAVPEEEFMNEIEMPFGPKTIRMVLWKLLLQWFNHHTHHRGQVSLQLDMLGIENDYSLVLDKIG